MTPWQAVPTRPEGAAPNGRLIQVFKGCYVRYIFGWISYPL